ncbi:hypothetical protein [Geotalea daltonii]|uniref:hypothetical protein n=1 Tax=Geotalea daltonii TaxID=1203471 RepID=UPI0018A84737|nr:hypothetical protein [Geotalea daltonii]
MHVTPKNTSQRRQPAILRATTRNGTGAIHPRSATPHLLAARATVAMPSNSQSHVGSLSAGGLEVSLWIRALCGIIFSPSAWHSLPQPALR